MKKKYLNPLLLSLFLSSTSIVFVSCDSASSENNKVLKAEVRREAKECPTASEAISKWSEKPKMAAQEMINKYGEPKVATEDMLIWENNGIWKKTVVYKEEVKHNFPKPHTDLLEQFIDYKVPTDKFDELAMFDGSVIVERTKGVLSARCDKEAMNILAINLANDVATGKKTVKEAREFYAKTAMAFMNGETPAYTQKLQFQVAKGNTADLDKPMPMMDQAKNKQMKDDKTMKEKSY